MDYEVTQTAIYYIICILDIICSMHDILCMYIYIVRVFLYNYCIPCSESFSVLDTLYGPVRGFPVRADRVLE